MAKKVGVQSVINQVEDDLGPIDILINHAAVHPHIALLDMDEWDWHRVLDVNLTAAFLTMLTKMVRLLPSHTRRSVESEELQQFSTPVPLALVASTAAAMIPADHVLEPSAGTGLLAIFAELAGASLVLNEIAETRSDLLDHLFPDVGVTGFDAARIHDHLDSGISAYGLFHEIITWKLRMFVPTDERGIEVLAKVLERYPLQRIAEREGA